MDSIAGKVALVTGASQGLGRVIAIELAKLGCRVVVNYANNSANAEQVKREIKQFISNTGPNLYLCALSPT